MIDINEIINELDNEYIKNNKQREYLRKYKELNKEKYNNYLLLRKELRKKDREERNKLKDLLLQEKEKAKQIQKEKKLEERIEKNRIACRERYRKQN